MQGGVGLGQKRNGVYALLSGGDANGYRDRRQISVLVNHPPLHDRPPQRVQDREYKVRGAVFGKNRSSITNPAIMIRVVSSAATISRVRAAYSSRASAGTRFDYSLVIVP